MYLCKLQWRAQHLLRLLYLSHGIRNCCTMLQTTSDPNPTQNGPTISLVHPVSSISPSSSSTRGLGSLVSMALAPQPRGSKFNPSLWQPPNERSNPSRAIWSKLPIWGGFFYILQFSSTHSSSVPLHLSSPISSPLIPLIPFVLFPNPLSVLHPHTQSSISPTPEPYSPHTHTRTNIQAYNWSCFFHIFLGF